MVPCIVYILKYFIFMWNMDQVKYAFEWIQCDYDSLTNERELRFVEKFADQATTIVKSILYCLTFIFLPLGFPFLAVLFNIETPVNQSRSVLIPFKVEHFVDQDRYFYWIMFHIDATTVLGVFILLVTESTFVHFTTHACGLLEIVGVKIIAYL
ncbi:uncharacterized protein LOC143375967 [Andrena cerasifolii]|uniref:uncharacterized protein LOC143375967 n=1 Tax=Andrena cerasifolii TaxID=2819439 RepID=UPI004038260C